MKAPLLLVGALALFAGLGCGPQFDPSNEIKTLRVLGVKKDKPYAQPGDAVNLQLLWHDPKGRTGAEVQRAFIGGCVNPPGDLYYGCFGHYGQSGELPALGMGDTFQVTLPDDIISSRRDLEPGQTRYGLYIVFFAVCAGKLDFDAKAAAGASGSEGLPLRCLDDAGKPLASEDFVVGYTSIYSFEGVSNQNPAFSVDDEGKGQFLIGEQAVVSDCIGKGCQLAAP